MRRVPRHQKSAPKPPPKEIKEIISLEIREPVEIVRKTEIQSKEENSAERESQEDDVKNTVPVHAGDPSLKDAMAKLFSVFGEPLKKKESTDKKKEKGKRGRSKEKFPKKEKENKEDTEKPPEDRDVVLEIMRKGLPTDFS